MKKIDRIIESLGYFLICCLALFNHFIDNLMRFFIDGELSTLLKPLNSDVFKVWIYFDGNMNLFNKWYRNPYDYLIDRTSQSKTLRYIPFVLGAVGVFLFLRFGKDKKRENEGIKTD